MHNAVARGPVRPTPPSERIQRVDVLRGFALFGVLLVNLFESDTILPTAEESWIGAAVNFLAEGSFYPLFSLLFGLGFAIQLSRFEERGQPFVVTYVRRALSLVAIGVALWVFLLGNPILMRYGSLALLLLLFRHASARAALIASVVMFAIVLAVGPARKAWADHQRANPVTSAQFRKDAAASQAQANLIRARSDAAMKTGSYGDIVAVRSQSAFTLLAKPWFYLNSRILHMFVMFLLGLFTARRGLITNVEVDRVFLRKAAIAGLALGVVGNAALLLLPRWTTGMTPFMQRWVRDLVYYIANPALGIAYGASLVLLIDMSETWRRRFSPLSWVGRMALTNFLLQFAFMLALFYLQRSGAFQYTLPAVAVVLSVLLFAFQIWLSGWWLTRFHFGPAEWLWRILTFGTAKPLRIQR